MDLLKGNNDQLQQAGADLEPYSFGPTVEEEIVT